MKTDFVNGTTVEPEFLDKIFNHVHDGVDDDGHNSLIDLGSNVAGILPLTNQASHVHDGVQRSKVDPDSHVLGVTIGQFSVVFTGFSTPISTVVSFRLRESQAIHYPDIVELCFSLAIMGASNTNAFESAVGTLPEILRPDSSFVDIPIMVYDNSLVRMGGLRIGMAGDIRVVLAQVAGSAIEYSTSIFTTTGSKGFSECCIHYPINFD